MLIILTRRCCKSTTMQFIHMPSWWHARSLIGQLACLTSSWTALRSLDNTAAAPRFMHACTSTSWETHKHDEDENEQIVDRQQVLRELLRKAHAAEAAMATVLAGQQLVLRNRPDAAFFADQERDALNGVKELLPRYRVRPSALLSVLQGAGLVAGAAAALAPAGMRNTVIAALQETLTDLYNDQLRELRAAGLSNEAPDVRAVMLKLRDLERAAEGAAAPPDILTLQKFESIADVGVQGVVGALVKAAADAAVAASGKV